MREHENDFKAAGAELAAIGLGDAIYARQFREETRIAFPLLVDDKRVAYRTAGLKGGSIFDIFRRENAQARQRARAAGHKQHRLGRNPFQLGGSFVFGPGNRDIYAYVSGTFSDNAAVEALLDAVRSSRHDA